MTSALPFRARLRAFEEKCQRHMPEFKCSVHLCLGQEAVPEMLHDLLLPDDWLFSTHRSHGHYLAKGGSEAKLWDEILGLPTGVNGGFSGSQSFCDSRINFHSTAIVGGLIAAATGTALALKLRAPFGSPTNAAVCCLGDGATEQGVFWESLNFAALHKLPIVFVVENNGLSVHAPISARQARPLGPKVAAFGAQAYFNLTGIKTSLAYIRSGVLGMSPAVVEIPVERECNHVSAMEDLRE